MRTPVTNLLLGAIVLMFVVETLLGGSTRIEVLVFLGANVPELVAQGQWWRLVAAMFLHIGMIHLAVNGYALYQLGHLFESLVGSGRFLAVYFGAGVAGSIASVIFTRGVSAGASGAIFGLLGALLGFLLKRRDRLTPAARSLLAQLGFWAVINIFLGFTVPQIDNAAHLGGLAVGLAAGFLVAPRQIRRAGTAG